MSRKTLVPLNFLNSSSAPTTPTLRPGDSYFNTSDGLTYVYNGSSWVALGSSTPIIFSGFDGGIATTTVFDLTLDIGAAN